MYGLSVCGYVGVHVHTVFCMFCHECICVFPQAVEKMVQGAESGCPTEKEKQIVLNCARMLSRILPYIFEDQDWRGFFWSTIPGAGRAGVRRTTECYQLPFLFGIYRNWLIFSSVTSRLYLSAFKNSSAGLWNALKWISLSKGDMFTQAHFFIFIRSYVLVVDGYLL